MRIIAGHWAGHTLVSPSGRVRPSAEAVRAALMELVADTHRSSTRRFKSAQNVEQ